MQFTIAFVTLFTAVLAAVAAPAEERAVTYKQGTCSTVTQRCYLAGGSPSYACDSQSGVCGKTGSICTIASSNLPGSGPYATGKAHCT